MAGFKRATRQQIKLRMAIDGPSGTGKAQPDDCGVLTPTGYRKMVELKVGDSVIGSNGKACLVTGVYPQGEKEVYRVIFSDGSSTRCCEDHLWLTQSPLDRAAKRLGTVKPLKDIAVNLTDKHGKHNHYVPMVRPVEFNAEPLPIDSYLFGVLLGDGCFQKNFIGLSNPDHEIQESVRRLLPAGVHLQSTTSNIDFGIRRDDPSGPNAVLDSVRVLGLSKKKSVEKFIPDCFKYASVSDRIALLQGLLDTDGYAEKSAIEYSTSSPRLADDFRFLVESLGGTVSVSERMPAYTYRGERRIGQKSYRVYVSLPPTITPFRLTRKLNAYKPKTRYFPKRYIEAVEYVGKESCRCIAVDAPNHLYITEHCIVTHNTYTALRFAFALGKRVAMIYTEGQPSADPNNPGHIYQGLSPDGIPWEFDMLELKDFSPSSYTAAIQEADRAGYDVIIIDSLSHAWSGEGGALELKEKQGGNSYTAWNKITPLQNRMVQAILKSQAHVIVTMRSKTDYVLEADQNGKMVPRKVGMAPIQRPGMEYEFDIYASMDWSNIMTITKSRCPPVAGASIVKPTAAFMDTVVKWLDTGEAARPAAHVEEPATAPPTANGHAEHNGKATETQLKKLLGLRGQMFARYPDLDDRGKSELWGNHLSQHSVASARDLTTQQASEMIDSIRNFIEGK